MTTPPTTRQDTDQPQATVVEMGGRSILYVYPSIWPDGWSFVSPEIGHGADYSTEAEAWRAVEDRLSQFATVPFANQLIVICKERSTS